MRTANIYLHVTPGVLAKRELELRDTASIATNLTGYEFQCVCFPWSKANRSIEGTITIDDAAAGQITLSFPGAASIAANMHPREHWRGMLLSRTSPSAEWHAELIVNLVVEDLINE